MTQVYSEKRKSEFSKQESRLLVRMLYHWADRRLRLLVVPFRIVDRVKRKHEKRLLKFALGFGFFARLFRPPSRLSRKGLLAVYRRLVGVLRLFIKLNCCHQSRLKHVFLIFELLLSVLSCKSSPTRQIFSKFSRPSSTPISPSLFSFSVICIRILAIVVHVLKTLSVESRHSQSNFWKSNSIEFNRTQSVDWVWLIPAIKRNRTPNFVWVRFPKQSTLIEQLEPNRTQSIGFSSATELNRTQSNGLRSIVFGEIYRFSQA